ncbi:MAG TPA: DEAD/DEAH box helicase [Gemmataceae bacterium]|nr:DEAD/DEAH box helicase [Gemmataceae bacterium]
MTPFDRLHPALQYHVVNSLGWKDLRPFQQAVIDPVLAGRHLLVLAPTAGGKTEAAFFPLLSRMLTEGWRGLGVLYVCPIKALLNNLEDRLGRYCTLLGRRSALWHGDVAAGRKKAILRDPPDCLLTTPESLEVMLVSEKTDAATLFAGLRAVIVDEVHAFAGDDRGWHLLSVLSRIERLAGREFQRIGLSATVGNPEELLGWLAGTCEGPRQVCYSPEAAPPTAAQVRLDHVGSLHNAAVVISRLHRGEKRLVFVDSRSRAEQLARELRSQEVTTFVTHSSLSQEERRQAEAAFAGRDDCVIVATSVLELGLDVGDLHRVIQIDAPTTVSSFLQRMGRTGRRPGTSRNCLFLATDDDSLLRAAGLIELWSGGYIEPVVPPPEPYHILAQQIMALCLQERGVGRRDWPSWLRGVSAFSAMPAVGVSQVLAWMLAEQILSEDGGILWLGRKGEEEFGRKNFMDLFSVFISPPLFAVRHGRQELGFVDQTTFLSRREGPRVLLLGGRAWQVTHLDWPRRVAYVEATEETGRSRWRGSGLTLGFCVCQAMRRVLAGEEESPCWSRRARARLAALRAEHACVQAEGPSLLSRPPAGAEWWTFAGTRANATLGGELYRVCGGRVEHDALAITVEGADNVAAVEQAVRQLAATDASAMKSQVEEAALDGLKFSECLPKELARVTLASRLRDEPAIRAVLSQPTRVVSGA